MSSIPRRQLFLGVDIGTQGVRAVAVDDHGTLLASQSVRFDLHGWTTEQDPEMWWSGVVATLSAIANDLRSGDQIEQKELVALAVTSTSGTVIPLDNQHRPLHPALMYNDTRAGIEAAELQSLQPEIGINLSWGLPKMGWFLRSFPESAPAVHLWAHPADIILGRLTGIWGLTDETTALKTGYDPLSRTWRTELLSGLGIRPETLPHVVRSGEPIGHLSAGIAESIGLPPNLQITTGMTDGCASQVASGAARPGDWNTTIGTTLVIKGVTRNRVQDPEGRIYNHRHPDGYWMPGGASNTGADWIERDFPGEDLAILDTISRSLIPTGHISYPLRQRGERFPFVLPTATGFDPPGISGPELFAARMEGVAYLECLCYDLLEGLAGERVEQVYSAGGANGSETWLRIRANVLGRPVHRARHSIGAVGAAVIAASQTGFSTLGEATAAMVEVAFTHEPDELRSTYAEGYARFGDELRSRGYLTANGV